MSAVPVLCNYIGGRWVPSAASESVDVTNPATGEVLARAPLSGRIRRPRGGGRCDGGPARLAGDAGRRTHPGLSSACGRCFRRGSTSWPVR